MTQLESQGGKKRLCNMEAGQCWVAHGSAHMNEYWSKQSKIDINNATTSEESYYFRKL